MINGVSQAKPAQKAHSDLLVNVDRGPDRHVYFYVVSSNVCLVSTSTDIHYILYQEVVLDHTEDCVEMS